jgi:hypothetical protein
MIALPPELAAAYVQELTFRARAVAVRREGGELLAGAEPADVAGVVTARLAGYEIAVELGPEGLSALARHDAEQALRAVLSPG